MENKAQIQVAPRDMFRKWLELTRSFNGLTNQEIKFLGTLLYHRHQISKEVKNEIYLNKILFGTEMRKQLREEMGIKSQIFLNIISHLRKKKVITESAINKQYIPKMTNDNIKIIFELTEKDDKG